jgi:hypothetical protein
MSFFSLPAPPWAEKIKILSTLCLLPVVGFGQEFERDKSESFNRFLRSKSLNLPLVYLVNTFVMPLGYLIFGRITKFGKSSILSSSKSLYLPLVCH